MRSVPTRNVMPRAFAAVVAAAALAILAPAAEACECAFCPGSGNPAAGLTGYNEKMHDLALHGAKLQAVIDTAQPERLEESVHRLVRKWLALHSAFYTTPPASSVDPERWQASLTETNALLGRIFRKARDGDADAVRDRLPRLRQHWLQLDELLEVPKLYSRLRQLRADYTAYAEAADHGRREARWTALRDRLDQTQPAWERLAEKEHPDLFERPVEPVLERLKRIREASAEQRESLIREEADRLHQRLKTIDDRISSRLNPSGTTVGEK